MFSHSCFVRQNYFTKINNFLLFFFKVFEKFLKFLHNITIDECKDENGQPIPYSVPIERYVQVFIIIYLLFYYIIKLYIIFIIIFLTWVNMALFSIKFVNFKCISYMKLNKYFSPSLSVPARDRAFP